MPTSTSRTRGSKALGRWGGLLRGQVFGLTGLGDRTTVSVFTHLRLQGAADGPARPRFPSWPQRPRHLRLLHLRVGEADDSRRACARQDAAQHVRGRLSVRPPPGLFGARLGRHGLCRPGRCAQPRSTSPATAFASASLRLGFDSQQSDFRQCRLIRWPSRTWRASAILELRQGMHILGATHDCGPPVRRLPRAWRCPAEPARRPVGRDGAALYHVRRGCGRSRS